VDWNRNFESFCGYCRFNFHCESKSETGTVNHWSLQQWGLQSPIKKQKWLIVKASFSLVSSITSIPWLQVQEDLNLWVQGYTCVFCFIATFYLWILSIWSTLQKGLVYTFCPIEQGIISSACLWTTWIFKCESTRTFLEFVSSAAELNHYCIEFSTNYCIGDRCPEVQGALKSVLLFGA
jgi:hypothetical protein